MVNEYLDNELADDDEDAKKIRKAEKEAKKKIVDACVHKMTRGLPGSEDNQGQTQIPRTLRRRQTTSPW